MQPLPVDEIVQDVIQELAHNQALVIEAPPGAGKSTRLPARLFPHINGRILLLEPRRVATRSIAARIASELGVKLGNEVGYQVRFDDRTSKHTKLVVMTEGILASRLYDDPFLDGVDLVILDEFHERSIHSDLTLAFLKEVLEAREDLRVMIMSATIGTQPLIDYLGAKLVRSDGQIFPVEVEYQPERLFEKLRASRQLDPLVHAVQKAVDSKNHAGDILVFLPGAREINACLAGLKTSRQILTLFGSMKASEQDRVLEPSQQARIILATNIAETSLTIPGVRTVIDSGLQRQMTTSPASGFETLELTRISMASAKQRAGRSGREGPGHVIRLWSPHEEHLMPEFETPEVHRIDLTAPVLGVWNWTSSSAHDFDWFEAPSPARITRAEEVLSSIGALDAGELTDAGRSMNRSSLSPRLSRVLLEAKSCGISRRTARIVAILNEADFAENRPNQPWDSDLLFRESLFLAGKGHPMRLDLVRKLESRLSDGSEDRVSDDKTVLQCLMAGFPDRIGIKRSDGYAISGGYFATLSRESVLFENPPDFVIAHQILDTAGTPMIRQASRIEPEWLVSALGHLVETSIQTEFNQDLERVVARQVKSFIGLAIESKEISISKADPLEVAETLRKAAATDWDKAFGINEKQDILHRLEFLRDYYPEEIPSREALQEALSNSIWGKSSFKELRAMSFPQIVQQGLTHRARSLLDAEAPTHIQVPSGRKHALDYTQNPPVLAVRIQELFGMQDAPRIAGGKVKVMLHLLAPNYRPQQVTNDLSSFWKNTYPEIRKELRARYPKHSWPENP